MTFKIDPWRAGREDCDEAVASGASVADLARPERPWADDALINAMNRDWVLDAAGADPNADRDAEWERVGIPRCKVYNDAFRLRAEEIAEETES